MKCELDKKFKAHQASWPNYVVEQLLLLIPFIFIVSLSAIIQIFINPIVNFLWFISVLYSFFIFAFIFKIKTPPNDVKAFMEIYKAIQNLEYFITDKSRQHLKDAVKNMKKLRRHLSKMCSSSYSIAVRESFNKPIEKMRTNINVRIIPLLSRLINDEETKKLCVALEDLAFIFSEPSTIVQNLSKCNQILENFQDSDYVATQAAVILKTNIIRIPILAILGYTIPILVSWIYCYILSLDFIIFIRANPTIFIVAGTALFGVLISKFIEESI